MPTRTLKTRRLPLDGGALVVELLAAAADAKGLLSPNAARLVRLAVHLKQRSQGEPSEPPVNIITLPAALGDQLLDTIDELLTR